MGWLDDLLRQGIGGVPSGTFPLLLGDQFDPTQYEDPKRPGRQMPRPGKAAMRPEDQVPYSVGMLSPYGINWPAQAGGQKGIGSDYAAERPDIPLPPPAFSTDLRTDYLSGQPSPAATMPRAGGIGSDFAASGGVGLLSSPPSRGIGSDFVASGMPPSTNDPAAGEPVPFKDGVPIPRPRPDDAPAPMSMAPADARAQAPADALRAPAAPEEKGFLSQAGSIFNKVFKPENAPLLLAMGGGFAGKPSFGSAMSGGFAAAAPQAALLRREQLIQDSQNATVKALRAKGVPEGDIQAAALNPEYLKHLLSENFGGWKPITVGEGPFGKNIVMSGPGGRVMSVTDYMRKFGGGGSPGAPGAPQVPGSSGAASGSGAAPQGDIPEGAIEVPQNTQTGILKQGLRYYNPYETDPQKYLDQFSPEMQSGMKNYLAGKSLPVSNPRQAGMTAEIRKYAPLYAEKAGIDHSEVAIKGRGKMETDLADTISPRTAGGQITFGGTTLGHLEKVAESAAGLKNTSILGAAPASEAWNNAWNALSEEKKKHVRQFTTETGHYGQEVTKFYTGAPGGQEERLKFAKNMATGQAPAVMAGSIRGELQLLPERFEQIYDNIEKQLGKARAEKELQRAKVPEKINKIKEHLAQLDPNGPEAEEKKLYGGKFAPVDLAGRPAPGGGPAVPALSKGQTTTINGVPIQRID